MVNHKRLGVFQSTDGRIACDAWEIVEEIVERFARLQILQKCREGHACAGENGGANEDIRIASDYGVGH